MKLSRLHRRLAALAATLAISLQALWPLIAQAQPRVAGELLPVCTVNGITHYIELPVGKTPLEQRSAFHGEHCKLCVFGGAKASVVPSLSFSSFVPEISFEKPAPKQIPVSESLNHPSARPRAPPAIS